MNFITKVWPVETSVHWPITLSVKGEVLLSMQKENICNIFFPKKIFFCISQLKCIVYALKLNIVLKFTVLRSFPAGKNVLKVQKNC